MISARERYINKTIVALTVIPLRPKQKTTAVFLFLLFKGSSQTDESSSQRTSSSVLAKEALIEIDYSNLSEDLKVGPNNIIKSRKMSNLPQR